MNLKDSSKIATDILGFPGRLISGSKSTYKSSYPENLVVFNSNLCTEKGKIWYGDVDVTLDLEKLTEIAFKIQEKIYLLYEMDARFENEETPRLEKFVIAITPDGKQVLSESLKNYFPQFNS
jgi:hypothetical protein